MRAALPTFAAALVAGFAGLAALGGCTNATIDEAYGRPDASEWTYFEGSARDVVEAIRVALYQSRATVESVRDEAEGTIITVSDRFNQSRSNQILVQSTTVEGFTSRAQLYPVRDPLPRWLEAEVSGRI